MQGKWRKVEGGVKGDLPLTEGEAADRRGLGGLLCRPNKISMSYSLQTALLGSGVLFVDSSVAIS